MSIVNSIANFRNPIGEGCSRKAYYSKKYDVVVKVEKRDKEEWIECGSPTNKYLLFQSEREIENYNKLTEEERKLVAITGYTYVKGRPYVFAERVEHLDNLTSISNWEFRDMVEEFRMTIAFERIVRKLKINDYHDWNFGLTKDGRIVMIDLGA